MDESARLVDIPEYARVNKRGNYYARKKDMPYFADDEDVRGHLVIGYPTNVPGKMTPDIFYDYYCAPDAYEKKQEALQQKQKEVAQEAEETEETEEVEETDSFADLMEQRLHEFYDSISELPDDGIYCYPVNGYLAEKFFGETGLSEILDQEMGKERAFLLKLSAAAIATRPQSFEFNDLSKFPMELHMREDMDRYLSLNFWKEITEEQEKNIHRAWIKKVNPQRISSLPINLRVTLYHDNTSDDYGDSFFIRRIRTGTKYHNTVLIYRDENSGKLLAVENEKYDLQNSYKWDHVSEVYTIRNSDYPELQKASLHFFLPAYLFIAKNAVKQINTSIWIHPSEYKDQKALKENLKALDKVEPVSGYKIFHWKGSLEDVEGNWTLIENVARRELQAKNARNILNQHKKRLQTMSYYPASNDYMSLYFEIEKEDDESDFFNNAPFEVKFVKKATELFKFDAGRYLHFTTEEPMDDLQLIRNFWYEEDLDLQYSAYVNHGQTTDLADEYDREMTGRKLPLFLACMYRQWIYDHVGDLYDADFEVRQFSREIGDWSCGISNDGTVKPNHCSDRIKMLLSKFDTTPDDVLKYLSRVIRQEDYFSSSFSDEDDSWDSSWY